MKLNLGAVAAAFAVVIAILGSSIYNGWRLEDVWLDK
jgi:hypothetical protein